ncbi:MAG: hypothetical protein K9G59_18070, partial [Caulobacter sp.]|nr:hypothetical protein [Caulobacter sp.]
MIGTYEKRQVANYLHNAQSWIGNRMQRARLLAQWCADQGESLGIIVDHEDIAPILGKEKCCWKKILVIVRTALDEAMKNTKDASPSAIALNIDFVCKFFRLDEVESKLLELSVLANQCTSIGELIGNLNEGGRQGVATVVSALIGADANETAARLKATSKLIESGLLVMDYHVEGQLSVPDRLLEA